MALEREQLERTAALTRLDENQKRLEDSSRNLEEQKALIEVMKKELSDTFTALSSAALKSSSEDFLRLATESLGRVMAETKGSWANISRRSMQP